MKSRVIRRENEMKRALVSAVLILLYLFVCTSLITVIGVKLYYFFN